MSSMPADLNIPVNVIASFQAGQLRPRVMEYGGRTIRFLDTSLLYAEGEGEHRTVYCTVYTSEAVYALAFKPHYLTWRLLSVTDENIYENR